jgi:hypothetical protein
MMDTLHNGPGRRRFYLVQRLEKSPYEKHLKAFPDAKVKSNPFGYGRMGDYELDYMGAAEYEFGAIPASNNRLAAGKIELAEHEFQGHKLLFLFTEEDGDPFDEWVTWAQGKPADATTRAQMAFDAKNENGEFKRKLSNNASEYDRTAVWWALNEDVMWAFVEEDGSSHLLTMLESMGSVPTEFLR